MRTHIIRRTSFTAGLLTAMLCLGLLSGCSHSLNGPKAPELLEPVDQQVQSYTVAYRDIYKVLEYETDILPEITELSFAGSGLLNNFYVKLGDTVTEGQLLASLQNSSAQYDALVAQYQNLVDSNAYNNRLTEINIEIAKLRGEDTSRSELVYKHTKESQELELSRLMAQIEEAKESLRSSEIVAPTDGVIISLADLYYGDAISAESPVIALATFDTAYVTCDYMSAQNVGFLNTYYLVAGDKHYELTYVPYPDKETLAAAITAGKARTTFAVKGDPKELVGQFGVIHIVRTVSGDTSEIPHVLAVPINSLYKEDGAYYVYVMEGETRIKTPVDIGDIGVMYAEVRSGLTEGVKVYVKE